jgi:hypothetical protein
MHLLIAAIAHYERANGRTLKRNKYTLFQQKKCKKQQFVKLFIAFARKEDSIILF